MVILPCLRKWTNQSHSGICSRFGGTHVVRTPSVECPTGRTVDSDGLGAGTAGAALLNDGIVEQGSAFYSVVQGYETTTVFRNFQQTYRWLELPV